MNQRKPNRIVWYSLVLILVLCAGFAAVSTGTAFARYRSELRGDVTFEVREPEYVCLGIPGEKNTFQTEEPQWIREGGVAQMTFAVANGTSDADCSRQDQKVYVRFLPGSH